MKVIKRSGKPFKSGKRVNTVTGEVINHHDPKKRTAYTFREDDSFVNKDQCEQKTNFFSYNKSIGEDVYARPVGVIIWIGLTVYYIIHFI